MEAAGQRFRSFRNGLDYAFIRQRRMRSVLFTSVPVNPSIRPLAVRVGEPMSLYRAVRVSPFLPLGVASCRFSASKRRQVSPM